VAYLHARHFSLEEARALLFAEVKALAEEMQQLKANLDALGLDISRHAYFGGAGPNGEQYFPRDLERLVEILKRFDDLGVIVKGIDHGLVDFPHVRRNGEEVYLCFLAGEEDLGWWHTLDGGFAGRRPIKGL
jgi:hypothetical protein